MKKTRLKIGRYTYLLYVLSAACCIAALTACSESGEDSFRDGSAGDRNDGDMVEIVLEVPSVNTRTSIDTDQPGVSASVKWDDGDAFGMWIRTSAGERLEDDRMDAPITFTHRDNGHDMDENLFVGMVPRQPMIDEFGYYAVYPAPAAEDVDGETVRCRIPSVQSGLYDDGADIMWASVTGGRFNQQLYNRLDFNFTHLTHALKITVPESANEFGCDIERIAIVFQQPVAGEMSVDVLSGETDLSNIGNNVIEVRFDAEHPFRSGEAFWVFTAPVDVVSGEVKFLAYNDTQNCMSYVTTANFSGREFAASTITPVSLAVAPAYNVTWFDYEVNDYSQLGEPVEKLTLQLPDGLTFADGENVMTESLTTTDADASLKFRFPFRSSDLGDGGILRGRTMTATYESEHAIVPDTRVQLAISDYTLDVHNDKTARAPYLFFEDFSTVGSFSQKDAWSTSNMGTNSYSFLDGWSGGRIGAMAGVAIRIACRRETALNNMPARVDSAPIANLKDGVTVKVAVGYDYGMDRWGGTLFNNGRNVSENFYQTVHLGYVKEDKVYNSGDSTMEEISSFQINELAASGGQDAGYYDIPHKDGYYEIPNCDNITRMTWRTTPQVGGGGNNNTFWLYLDNIRVTIVQ